ncbi:MAG: hypothetical protein VW378_05055 [bacterium]
MKKYLLLVICYLCVLTVTHQAATIQESKQIDPIVNYLYQDEHDKAMQTLRSQVQKQKFIHRNAWLVPSIIAQQKGVYQPKVLTLSHQNEDLQAAFDYLKIEQLVLGGELEYAELVFKNLQSLSNRSRFLTQKSMLALARGYSQQTKNITIAESYLAEIFFNRADPIIYPQALAIQIEIDLTQKRPKNALKNYAELITMYPERDPERTLFKKINKTFGKDVHLNDIFSDSEQRRLYLQHMLRAGDHKQLQSFAQYLLINRSNNKPVLDYIYIVLGLSYACELKFDEAIEMFREAKRIPLKFDSHSIAALYTARCYEALGQRNNAIQELKTLEGKKLVTPWMKAEIYYQLSRLYFFENQLENYYDYKRKLKNKDIEGRWLERLNWEESWQVLGYVQDEKTLITNLEDMISDPSLSKKVITAYQRQNKAYGFKTITENIAHMPLSYSHYLLLKQLEDKDLAIPTHWKQWYQNGLKELVIEEWRYQNSQDQKEDNSYLLTLSEEELAAYSILQNQDSNWSQDIKTIPSFIIRERFLPTHWARIKALSKSRQEAYVFLATNHQESQRYYNQNARRVGLNPKLSQVVNWAYEIEHELPSLRHIKNEEIQDISHKYFREIAKKGQSLVEQLITLKVDEEEAERVRIHQPKTMIEAQKWMENHELALFVKSVVSKTLLYNILTIETITK